MMYLAAFLAQAGFGARRKAIEEIKTGQVSVNGVVITDPVRKVTETDQIVCRGAAVKMMQKQYILLNKPRGYVTTLSDPQQRKTVSTLIPAGAHLFPVGRLDRDTTGLLLLTNDGPLAQQLMHPKFGVQKEYQILLDNPLSVYDFLLLRDHGVTLDDGPIKFDRISCDSSDRRHVTVMLHSGRKRIIRRVFASLHYTVVDLDRTRYAMLEKAGLMQGSWRELLPVEIAVLQSLSVEK